MPGEVTPIATLTPICGAMAFEFDGVFIGATWTRDMRNLMLAALGLYLALFFACGRSAMPACGRLCSASSWPAAPSRAGATGRSPTRPFRGSRGRAPRRRQRGEGGGRFVAAAEPPHKCFRTFFFAEG